MNFVPIMPLIFLALLLLPVKLSPRQLKLFAFALWLVGGFILAYRGADYMLVAAQTGEPFMMITIAALAGAIGVAKGKFVLSKTSRRNIERLNQLTEPRRPIFVYSARSWVIIGVMVLISLALTGFGIDPMWRGAINLGIGLSLVMSSLVYVKSFKEASAV